MSLNNDMTKHRVFVQRLAGTEAKSIGTFLDALKTTAKIEAAAGTAGKTLQSSLRNSISALADVALQNLADVAEYESKFISKLYQKYIPDGDFKPADRDVLAKKLVKTTVGVNKVHVHGGETVVDQAAKNKSLITMYKQFGQRKADELTQIIRDGQAKRLTGAEIFAQIDERVAGLQTAQARTLATTAINFSTNIAKSQTSEENRDIIEAEVWISTLDAGTCDYCESLHGEVFPVGEAPDAPAHWGCNCELIPYVG